MKSLSVPAWRLRGCLRFRRSSGVKLSRVFVLKKASSGPWGSQSIRGIDSEFVDRYCTHIGEASQQKAVEAVGSRNATTSQEKDDPVNDPVNRDCPIKRRG